MARSTCHHPRSPRPPPVTAPAASNRRCVGYEPLLRRYNPGWNVRRPRDVAGIAGYKGRVVAPVSGTGGRELQPACSKIMPSNCRYIAARLHEGCSAAKLRNASFNVRAAAVLFRYDGYGPWAQ